MSIAKAGCNIGTPSPEKFAEWCRWKLGDRIADDYMIPYNEKMFSKYLYTLGTYWLDKLPDVSFSDTIRSCLERVPHAKQPGHANFYYPKKFGYGELWKRMGEALGDKLVLSKKVNALDLNNHKIRTTNGDTYEGDIIVTTVPWKSYDEILGLSDDVLRSIQELKHTSIYVEYVPERYENEAQWVYYPQYEISFHRILARENFCENSKGYWTETNADRFNTNTSNKNFFNEYAYPVNTTGKPEIMSKLLRECERHDVYGLGRWGEHMHYNSDIVVDKAVALCEEMM